MPHHPMYNTSTKTSHSDVISHSAQYFQYLLNSLIITEVLYHDSQPGLRKDFRIRRCLSTDEYSNAFNFKEENQMLQSIRGEAKCVLHDRSAITSTFTGIKYLY
jgi:hypothetical protein